MRKKYSKYRSMGASSVITGIWPNQLTNEDKESLLEIWTKHPKKSREIASRFVESIQPAIDDWSLIVGDNLTPGPQDAIIQIKSLHSSIESLSAKINSVNDHTALKIGAEVRQRIKDHPHQPLRSDLSKLPKDGCPIEQVWRLIDQFKILLEDAHQHLANSKEKNIEENKSCSVNSYKGDKQSKARLLTGILIPIYIRHFNNYPPSSKNGCFYQLMSKLGQRLEPEFHAGEITIKQAIANFKE